MKLLHNYHHTFGGYNWKVRASYSDIIGRLNMYQTGKITSHDEALPLGSRIITRVMKRALRDLSLGYVRELLNEETHTPVELTSLSAAAVSLSLSGADVNHDPGSLWHRGICARSKKKSRLHKERL